jgi:hypothetical protein
MVGYYRDLIKTYIEIYSKLVKIFCYIQCIFFEKKCLYTFVNLYHDGGVFTNLQSPSAYDPGFFVLSHELRSDLLLVLLGVGSLLHYLHIVLMLSLTFLTYQLDNPPF